MKVETLETLRAGFKEWRSKKRHINEPIPAELFERAQKAASEFGIGPVTRVSQELGNVAHAFLRWAGILDLHKAFVKRMFLHLACWR